MPRARIAWAAPSDGGSPVTGYEVQRERAGAGFTTLATPTGLTYTDATAASGDRYRVRAVNANGNGRWSAVGTFGVPSGASSGAWLFLGAAVGSAPGTTSPGWLRTASNTGLAALGIDGSTLTTYSGSLTNVAASTVIENRRILLGGNQMQLGANVVLRRCEIRGAWPAAQGMLRITGANVVIEDCDIYQVQGYDNSTEKMVLYSEYVTGTRLSRNHVRGGTIGFWIDRPATGSTPCIVEDNYMWDQTQTASNGPHHEQVRTSVGLSPMIVRRNRLDCDKASTTGAIFINTEWGPQVGNVTIEDNYLEGNGYNLSIYDGNPSPSVVGMTVTNNRFRPTEYGARASRGVTYTSWTQNNIYDPASPPDYRGAVVTQP